MHDALNIILWTSADICILHDDLGWKNQTTRYILPRHWLYEWFSQFHSCRTYSVLSRSHSFVFCWLICTVLTEKAHLQHCVGNVKTRTHPLTTVQVIQLARKYLCCYFDITRKDLMYAQNSVKSVWIQLQKMFVLQLWWINDCFFVRLVKCLYHFHWCCEAFTVVLIESLYH